MTSPPAVAQRQLDGCRARAASGGRYGRWEHCRKPGGSARDQQVVPTYTAKRPCRAGGWQRKAFAAASRRPAAAAKLQMINLQATPCASASAKRYRRTECQVACAWSHLPLASCALPQGLYLQNNIEKKRRNKGPKVPQQCRMRNMVMSCCAIVRLKSRL